MPTYHRHDYALRGMRYWSGLGVRLLVLDGSNEPLSPEEMYGIGSSVTYLHSAVGMYERIRLALPYIYTPYAALISDDEFFLENGILAAMDFLDRNVDYIACGGQAMAFWRDKENVILAAKEYRRHKNFDLCEESPVARVNRHFSNYTPATIYSVARSGFFIDAISLITQQEFNAYALGELQYELFAAWSGKIKLLDNIYWMRSRENPPVRGTDRSLRQDRPVSDWWKKREGQEVEDFISITAKGMANGRGVSIDQARKVVCEAMDAYLGFLESYIPKKPGVIRKIKTYLNNRIFPGGNEKQPDMAMPLLELAGLHDRYVADLAKPDLHKINEVLTSWYSRDFER